MTPDQAADLAARTRAAIEARQEDTPSPQVWHSAEADLERVASDLAGLRGHQPMSDLPDAADLRRYCRSCRVLPPCADARRYAEGLRRTAVLYGVREPREVAATTEPGRPIRYYRSQCQRCGHLPAQHVPDEQGHAFCDQCGSGDVTWTEVTRPLGATSGLPHGVLGAAVDTAVVLAVR